MKTTVLHHRIPDDDIKTLDTLAGGMISRQQTATIILRRAISVMRANPEKFQLFPNFDLTPVPAVESVESKAKGKK